MHAYKNNLDHDTENKNRITNINHSKDLFVVLIEVDRPEEFPGCFVTGQTHQTENLTKPS